MHAIKSFVICVALLMFVTVQADTPVPPKVNDVANQSSVTDADGNTYSTVKIGNQVWTVENLRTTKFNDNSPIPLVKEKAGWTALGTPGYCFYDNSTNAKNAVKTGALYNWYAVNSGKLAPTGWHVPTIVEWDTLRNYLIMNSRNWAVTTTGNKIGKLLAAKTNWFPSRESATIGNDLTTNNASGFSAFPAGYRANDGEFYEGILANNLGLYGYWWSSTLLSTTDAWGCYLGYDNDGCLGNSTLTKTSGFSVRLVKN
jgi:uncharacterized protein (TIGR02145 family)